MIKHYWELSEEQKERMRAAHRKWKSKVDRRKYYQKYDKLRQGKRLTYKMLDGARRRARNTGLEFTIEENDIAVPTNCPICSNEMKEAFGIRGGNKNSPTLDRINNNEGYILHNVAVICKNCNALKGHASAFELRQIADWMDSFK